jgi:preprotein translocase subunit SecE
MASTAVARPGVGTRVGTFFRGLPAFYRDVMVEMRKVTWPDRAQLQDATIKIIVLVLFLGAVIALMDLGLQFFLVRLPQLLLGR